MQRTNVSIRRYRTGDAEPIFEAARESWRELQPFMPWAHEAYSLAESEAWVKLASESTTQHECVILGEDGAFLGGCGINQIDTVNRRANVGYWVRSSAAGRGVATAAVQQLIRWAAENTELRRLEIVVAVENAASLRVAEKVGAVREGVLRSRILLHGVFHDAVLFSVILTPREARNREINVP